MTGPRQRTVVFDVRDIDALASIDRTITDYFPEDLETHPDSRILERVARLLSSWGETRIAGRETHMFSPCRCTELHRLTFYHIPKGKPFPAHCALCRGREYGHLTEPHVAAPVPSKEISA